jgi:alanine dehydrogenase
VIVGVPKEIKEEENRVGLTPLGVSAFVAHGHRVMVEKDAGKGSGLSDRAYEAAGAFIVGEARKIWEEGGLVIKVKEPIPPEYSMLRSDQVIFTYFHLAAGETLTRVLLEKKITSVAYETIQLDDGSLPLLTPMSEVAGRLAVQVGAWCLQAENGGLGILLGGASGVRPAKVVILGAGVSGSNACQVAVGIGTHVSILDVNPSKLRYLHDILGGHVTTVMSNRASIEEEMVGADLVISTVLIPGARTPELITRKLVRMMKPGAAIVDVAIDQGGTSETSRPTTHRHPIFLEEGVVHYCVTNMPSIVPNTSTFALTNVTLSYGLELADRGLLRAMAENRALRHGLNTHAGRVFHKGVAEAFGLELTPVEEILEGRA